MRAPVISSPSDDRRALSHCYILKIASRCNLNCSYCYIYNKGDTTFRSRPRVMSKLVASRALDRIFEYARDYGLERLQLVLHGGEPLLAGKEWVRWFLGEAQARRPEGVSLTIGVQTNGTLFDEEWLALFAEYDVGVGISIDGPPEWHDRHRVAFNGRGSYAEVRRAIDLLRDAGEAGPSWGVLVVADPECPAREVYEHLLEIGARKMDFLWPEYHHDSPPPWVPGALAEYYIELFDLWYGSADPSISVRWLENALSGVVGKGSQLDSLGPGPLSEVVIETDGSLEPLDVLRICRSGITSVGLNVRFDSVDDLRANEMFRVGLENEQLLPQECRECPAFAVCGGAYLPTRWGRERGFSNPSVHSRDLLRVIEHIARRVDADLVASGSSLSRVNEAMAPLLATAGEGARVAN